jgi:Ser/Thr protein kinase RdoA (MazF antagonist)
VPDYQRIAAEFGLGPLLEVTPLAGGRADVVRLAAAAGEFVAKPAERASRAAIYERAARVLNRAGVRQARPRRTTAGSLIGGSGHTVQEFLPGRICLHPTQAQATAAMRQAGVYHAELASVPVPAALAAEDTVFTRVVSPGYLIERLPDLVRRAGLPGDAEDVVERALGLVGAALPRMRQLPVQLVHGDIGPDNVLMDGDQVVAVIDFTPFAEPVLFAVATAVYWYHVHGQPTPDWRAVLASFAAAAPPRGWTSAETALWPVMLLREALRRLATPLALAGDPGTLPSWPESRPTALSWPESRPTAVPAAVIERYQAVRSVLRHAGPAVAHP